MYSCTIFIYLVIGQGMHVSKRDLTHTCLHRTEIQLGCVFASAEYICLTIINNILHIILPRSIVQCHSLITKRRLKRKKIFLQMINDYQLHSRKILYFREALHLDLFKKYSQFCNLINNTASTTFLLIRQNDIINDNLTI